MASQTVCVCKVLSSGSSGCRSPARGREPSDSGDLFPATGHPQTGGIVDDVIAIE